jgi:hypothetical protein
MANDQGTSGAGVKMTGRKLSLPHSTSIRWVLRVVTAAGLGVQASVHWNLAPGFDTLTGATSPHLSEGTLFRLEAVLALIALLLVLSTPRRFAMGFAFMVAAGGLAALLLYGYVDVGGLGPLPDMYDPIWYTEKTVSAVAEAVAALAAFYLFLVPGPGPDRGAGS